MPPSDPPGAAAPAPADTPVPWGRLSAVIAVIAAYSLTVGYVYPAVAFNLKLQDYSPLAIGAQSAMSGFGILVGSFATPWLTGRWHPWPVALAALVISALAIISLGFIPPIAAWFPLRFIIGFTASALFIVSETWINQLAPDNIRGRIIGIYTSVLAGVFALGPVLTSVLGYSGILPFLLVGCLLLVMGAPLLTIRHTAPDFEHSTPGTMLETMRMVPVLMLGVGCFGFFDGALLTLWPVYALDSGIDTDRAAFLLFVLIVGNVVLQFPIGWLADKLSRRSLFTLCSAVAFFGSVMLPLVDLTETYALVYLVVWGTLSFGIYTLSMTIVGENLTGRRLIAANAGFGVMWGLGAVGGSAITGTLMDMLGRVGLPVSLGVVFGALTLTSLFFAPIRISTDHNRH